MEQLQPIEVSSNSGCKLLDSFAVFVQTLLACLAFSTLIIKRRNELPQRPFFVWLLDISKQVIGGIVVHSLNIVVSHLFGTSLDGEPQSNPCVWYFLNILVDTTFGVLVIWAVLSLSRHIARFYHLEGFESGVYGEGDYVKFKMWSKQLGVYILALLVMKIVVLILFGLCPWLKHFGRWMLGWTMGNYKIQVVFVMLIFPLMMNSMQFWVVDTIIKHKTKPFQLSLEEENIPISDEEHEDFEQGPTYVLSFDSKTC